jgi:hypothetical protein
LISFCSGNIVFPPAIKTNANKERRKKRLKKYIIAENNVGKNSFNDA